MEHQWITYYKQQYVCVLMLNVLSAIDWKLSRQVTVTSKSTRVIMLTESGTSTCA